MRTKNLHLLLSVLIIVPVGIVYGLIPDGFMHSLFPFEVAKPDQSNIFRALMGLYIGTSIFWITGIIKPQYWRAATLSNILFMGGLAIGRLVGIVMDGSPTTIFLVGLGGEIALAAWGAINLSRYGSNI